MIFIQLGSAVIVVAAMAAFFLAMRVETISMRAARQLEDLAFVGLFVSVALLLVGCWQVVW